MTKEDFEQQINALIPQPDSEITADLFEFGQELGLEDECFSARELLTSLQFIARNFSERTLQGAYEIISYGSAALPDEMVAAAVYLENGGSPQEMAKMAEAGTLMCFHRPESAEESSPLAVCTVIEDGIPREFHTLWFGGFDPETALRSAREYAQAHRSSVTGALLSLTTDMEINPDARFNKLLVSRDPDMTQALSAVFSHCPAVAARLTFDADRGQSSVEYNPLWLELRQKQEPVQGGMQLTV
jgi:hypothetical protein|nr:hypothetical protein [uncultured Oscillibacter sp.]